MYNKALIAVTTAFIAFSTPVLAADTDTYTSDSSVKKDSNGNYSEKDTTTNTAPDGVCY